MNPPVDLGPYPITQEYLRSILSYDEDSGVFTWVKPPWNHPRMLKRIAGATATGFEKKLITIGTFDTPEEAAAAYLAEAHRLYGDFARAA